MVLPFLAAIAPFASLIGGAIGAVGQLMAPKPKTGIDLGQLRRDAEENGFNPLTVLRSGAAGMYGHVADTRFSNAMQTFGSGVASWQYDPYGQAKSQAELGLAHAQIGYYSRLGSAPANMSLGVPSASGTHNETAGQNWRFLGIDFLASPDFSNADVMEKRHGDLTSSLHGFATVPADIAHTIDSYDWNKFGADFGNWMGFGNSTKKKPITITVKGGNPALAP